MSRNEFMAQLQSQIDAVAEQINELKSIDVDALIKQAIDEVFYVSL